MTAWGTSGYWDDSGKWVNGKEPDGFAMGTPYDNQPNNPAVMPNNQWNKTEAKQLADAAFAWKPTATATHYEAPSMTVSGVPRSMQEEMLARIANRAGGGGPSVSAALAQEGTDAALRAQMAAGRGGGALANRAVLGAGAQMHGDNTMKYAAGATGEQQAAYNAMVGAAAGVRGHDIAYDVERAKLAQQAAMANAGADQAVALANQRAQMQAHQNQLGAAGTYGSLVQDAFGADLGYRDHLNKITAWEQAKRDAANKRTAAMAGQGIDTFAKVLSLGMVNAGQANSANATPTGGKG
jgi:hypothetical protein